MYNASKLACWNRNLFFAHIYT